MLKRTKIDDYELLRLVSPWSHIKIQRGFNSSSIVRYPF